MKHSLFNNRMNMATTCAKCARPLCDCTDAEWSGTNPEIDPAAPVDSSGAVKHRAGLYSDTATGSAQ